MPTPRKTEIRCRIKYWPTSPQVYRQSDTTKNSPIQRKKCLNFYTLEKCESICVKKKAFDFQITHWILGDTSNTLGFFIRSIDRLTDFIVNVNRINFREFVRHLCYNIEEKHHFVPFKIFNVLFGGRSMNMIIHTTFYDGLFTAAQRHSNKKSAHRPTNNSYTSWIKNSVVKRARTAYRSGVCLNFRNV